MQKVDSQRWNAVLNRDGAADGTFFYGVRSTGIFCRPTCPSKRPNQDNVQFFGTVDAAETAGYRACKRCVPTEPNQPAKSVQLCRQICRFIESADRVPSLSDLAEQFQLSQYHLQRTFKQVMKVSPQNYAKTVRSARLRENLKCAKTVTEAVFESGFESLSTAYVTKLGMTPNQFKTASRTKQATVSYTVARTDVGWAAVGATDRGICAVLLSDTASGAKELLLKEFPAAKEEVVPFIEAAINLVRDYGKGNNYSMDLPLDIRATAFQSAVWTVLRKIPYGRTASYTEIAQALEAPQAVRAVARACASNKVALLIPCHRVLRSDGTISGYRWGTDRKQALLDLERSKSTE